jgi:translation initiation factor eIF-2B subunit epsilon
MLALFSAASALLYDPAMEGMRALTAANRSTLVVYVYSDTEPQYRGNLAAFITLGVRKDETADYYIVLQQPATPADSDLPELPAHAQYVSHKNECYDW